MLSWLNVGRSVTAPSASSFSLFSAKARPVAVDDEWEEQSRSGDILSRRSGSALRAIYLSFRSSVNVVSREDYTPFAVTAVYIVTEAVAQPVTHKRIER